MISVKEFQKLSFVWDSVAPFLDIYARRQRNQTHQYAESVPMQGKDPSYAAFVAELGFDIARKKWFHKKTTNQALAQLTLRRLIKLDGYSLNSVSPKMMREASKISDNILDYIRSKKCNKVIYSPEVPGCGIVDKAVADLLVDDELIEIKAVKRPFASSDYKQLLTYTCMLWSAGKNIQRVTLLNPRWGVDSSFPLSSLALSISGCTSATFLHNIQLNMQELRTSA